MSHDLMNDSEANNQSTHILKELNLSPGNVPIWWEDIVIVSITDSRTGCLKREKRKITTEQAVHLFLGQLECVSRLTVAM